MEDLPPSPGYGVTSQAALAQFAEWSEWDERHGR